MQKRFLENVVDKMIIVYENCKPGELKYKVGFFAISSEALRDFARIGNQKEEEFLNSRIEEFTKIFENVDFTDEAKNPSPICPMVERDDADISYLAHSDVPVIFMGYSFDQDEATRALRCMMLPFVVNYRALVKKGLSAKSSTEETYTGPKVDEFVSKQDRGNLAKELRARYDSLVGFRLTGQKDYHDKMIASIKGFFAGTPLLALAEEMISVVQKMDPSKNGENKPLQRLGEQYIPLLTATAFEDYKGAAEYKKNLEQMKQEISYN